MERIVQAIICDLDDTLAYSKTPIDSEMGELVGKQLKTKYVAIVSGGSYEQFQEQVVKHIHTQAQYYLKNLLLFPTSATSFYRFKNGWEKVYEAKLTPNQKKIIMTAFEDVLKESEFKTMEGPFGKIIEDRDSQITFSALGQKAPLNLKQKYDPTHEKRNKIVKKLKESGKLSDFEIVIGGTTSIDVYPKPYNKGYCVEAIRKYCGVEKNNMVFIGDALYEGGNDSIMLKTGIECIPVSGPEDTKAVIRKIA